MSSLCVSPRQSIALLGLALMIAISGASRATAQTEATGRIIGSVRRDDGRMAPAATVLISTTDGRLQRMAKTNAQGRYIFSELPAGSYVMQGCSEEFGPSMPEKVELKAGTDATQDLTTPAGFVKTTEPACGIDSTADSPSTPPPPHEYTGKLMSVDIKGDAKEFFRAVALASGLELDVEASVNRVVAVHLKDIPWDLALDVVLKTSGLGGEEVDGRVLRIAMANPGLGQDRVLMGTTTIEGKVTDFKLQNPRSILQVTAPNADGAMQTWPVEWEDAQYLNDLGVGPNTLRSGDRVILTGSITRTNAIRLIRIQRLSDGFSWGYLRTFPSAPSDGVMFVSSTLQ